MRFCYLDESGTSDFSDPGSHFIFLGLSIPGETWKTKDQQVTVIKRRYGLEPAEIHAGWLARRYPEQEKIPNFETLTIVDRRRQVQAARDAHLVAKAATKGLGAVKGDRKDFMKTSAYIQLTLDERRQVLRDLRISFRVGTTADCSRSASPSAWRTDEESGLVRDWFGDTRWRRHAWPRIIIAVAREYGGLRRDAVR